MYSRYAVYFTPNSNTPFGQFGARWLGWDTETGKEMHHPTADGFSVQDVTRRPRKYGFHATLKPPFRLADGQTVNALRDAIATLAQKMTPVELDGLELGQIGSFFALRPTAPSAALERFASEIVRALEPFRAPLNEAELTKRLSGSNLTTRQLDLLTEFGYPYVLEEFKFHMTLTGPVGEKTRPHVRSALEAALAPYQLSPFTIDTITLLGEAEEDGRFHQIARFPLSA